LAADANALNARDSEKKGDKYTAINMLNAFRPALSGTPAPRRGFFIRQASVPGRTKTFMPTVALR
jgi:hypothetical protein